MFHWYFQMTEPTKSAPKFVAVGQDVKQGQALTVARATSGTMAKRIANALNAYTPDSRGQ
jgi:hypothetical protein